MRILKLGHDMIDNVFQQMHDLIDRAKSTLKDQFKVQMASAIKEKFQKQTTTVNDHINKLEEYLASVTPELVLLRTQGKHLLLSK